ncbi:hypothetical protein CB0940_07011 [Lecanosticta acicola]|uniref:N-acetyltransferase domain-containing protein n=1 Tax=Lecanosticta acicola TaxID=111012 RepID=A0AAI8YVL3_9PEZI|nr:hypothetical protein CB0940_07011 [Lecanosticta acicola]
MGRLHPKAHFLDLSLAHHTPSGHSRGLSTSTTTSSTTTTTTTTVITATPASFFAGASRAAEVVPLRLAPREESTRVQLQKQRLRDQHAKQLVSTTTIPGFKTSAAFFASLRTNLRLHASPPPSPLSTPNSMRGSAASLPPPSPLSVPIMSENENNDVPPTSASEDPLAGVPELQTYVAKEPLERVDALKLVADSVAQQKNAANRALLFHPLNLGTLISIMAVVVRVMLDRRYDLLAAGMTCLGITMIGFVGCRYLTGPYLAAAERINWEWTGDVDVLMTRFGDEVIGTVLLAWESGDSKRKGKKAWRGVIKGWTVKLRYRHKGVGTGLLEEAVKEAKKKGAESLEFDEEHANSVRILPNLYNGSFDRSERMAREKLQALLESSPVKGKRK